MKNTSIAVLFALLLVDQERCQGFVPLPSVARTIAIATCQPPLFISTELTAESVGQSSADDNEGEAESSISVEIPVVDESSDEASTATAAVEEEPADVAAPSAESGDATDDKPQEAPRHTLFIGNIPFGVDEETVRIIPSEFGQVVKVVLPKNRDTGKPRGFAFVDMATKEDMEAAIAGVDGRLLDGRVLRASVTMPKDKQAKRRKQDSAMAKVHVGNIAYSTTQEELSAHFQQYGMVFEVYLPQNDQGQSRGFAFVTVKKDQLESVIENANGSELNERALAVTLPVPRGSKPKPRRPARTKVYVGNLSFYTSQDTLGEVFSEFGNVYDCYIPMDNATGSSRGFGFVTMDPEDAQHAIDELDECELDGRIIRVNEAQPKERRQTPPPEEEEDEGDEEV